jgi:hypothetical protein
VPFDVLRGGPQETGFFPEEAERVVAALAEQLPDTAGRVVVVEVLR